MARPDFAEISSGDEFARWYWLKEELVAICKKTGLPHSGSKFVLQDRIRYALDHDGAVLPAKPVSKKTSRFNWAKAELSLETVITDNVSFGPNFRRFMTAQIGPRFVCHGDFMAWVTAHVGQTLGDAVAAWEDLERRKDDPEFRREIADHNMYNQYVRDFMDDRPGTTLQEAEAHWRWKKQQPTTDGFVRYAKNDLPKQASGA